MNDLAIALPLHVLSIVLWIGGVGLATIALLPALRRTAGSGQAIAMFEAVESRFEPVARASTIVTGATGLYMIGRLGAWTWRRLDWFGSCATLERCFTVSPLCASPSMPSPGSSRMPSCVGLLKVCVGLRDTAVTMPLIDLRSSLCVPGNKYMADRSTALSAIRSASDARRIIAC